MELLVVSFEERIVTVMNDGRPFQVTLMKIEGLESLQDSFR